MAAETSLPVLYSKSGVAYIRGLQYFVQIIMRTLSHGNIRHYTLL